jgi:hypothetical protein
MKNDLLSAALTDGKVLRAINHGGDTINSSLRRPDIICSFCKTQAKEQSINKKGIVRPFSGICLAADGQYYQRNQIKVIQITSRLAPQLFF